MGNDIDTYKITNSDDDNNDNNNNNNNNDIKENNDDNNTVAIKAKSNSDIETLGLIVSLMVLEQINFYLANPIKLATFASHLLGYKCSGSSVLRDAVHVGITKLIKMKSIIPKMSDKIDHKFIHIVITDGKDTASKISLNELSLIFLMMGVKLGDLCKTFFIGISLDDDELKQLEQLALLGGDSCELINEDVDKMDDIFSRIALSLGIEVEYNVCKSNDGSKSVSVTDASWAMKLEHQKYCVLFTLDTSSSMSGQKWKKLCLSILLFCKKLNKTDLFACQLFSNDVRTLTL